MPSPASRSISAPTDTLASTLSRELTAGDLASIVNRMVQYQVLDRTFSALSDPTRRDILIRLGHGPASIGELAKPFGMSLTGLRKHVQILEEANLVTTEKIGRTRQCRLGTEHLEDAMNWIEVYRQQWERRLDGLAAYFEQRKGQAR